MQLVKPNKFSDAARKAGTRTVIGSQLNSSEWSEVAVDLRDRAFFSATIESVRWLQGAKDFVGDFLTGARDPETGALKSGGRSQFVKEMREFAIANNLGPVDPKDAGGLKDIRSEARLGLIFNTQTQAANDYGYWKQGMDPDLINEFPAQRFIREADSLKPRAIHAQNEGVVRLKTNLDFWLAMNDPSIGGFGVPYGPWGFNSGMGVEDVDRNEAEALGLIAPKQKLKPIEQDFNDHLKASTRNLDPDLIEKLIGQFSDQIEVEENVVKWRKKKKQP